MLEGLTIAFIATAWVNAATAAPLIQLEDFTLIDGTGADARKVESLWIEDGIVVAIDDQGQAPELDGQSSHRSMDLEGAYVMPGLIDTHVHVARFPDTRRAAEDLLKVAVRGGVTSVRDLGGEARALGEIVRASHEKILLGPTLVFSALFAGEAVFESPYFQTLAIGHDAGTAPWLRAVDAKTDLPLAIAAARGAGVHGIKVYGNLDEHVASGIIREARRQGLMTWAHGTVFPTGPGTLVEAGIHSLSHAPYLVWAAAPSIPEDYSARTAAPWSEIPPDHPRIRALLKTMAERAVSLDATLYVFHEMQNFSPEVKAGWAAEAAAWGARVTALAHQLGVPITTGTDWFEPREDETLPHTHDELALLVHAAGLTPMQAIVAGTKNGARALGILDRRGTVELGKAADLIILDEDPTEDINHTRSIRHVIKDGQLVGPE